MPQSDLLRLLLFYMSLFSFSFITSDSYFLRIIPLHILDYFLIYLFHKSVCKIKRKCSLFSQLTFSILFATSSLFSFACLTFLLFSLCLSVFSYVFILSSFSSLSGSLYVQHHLPSVTGANFAFSIYDLEGNGTVDAFYVGDILRGLNLNPTLAVIEKMGGTKKRSKQLKQSS